MALKLVVALQYFVLLVLCKTPTEISQPLPRLLDTSNPFRENLAKNISIDDEVMKELLSARHHTEPTKTAKKGPRIIEYKLNNPRNGNIIKRADFGPSPYGPLIDFKGCLFCEGKAKRDATLSVAQFQAEHLISKMTIGATQGECLFYGQRPAGSNPPSLSNMATDYACQQNSLTRSLRTIWQLWPNEGCDTEKNYYCLNPRAPGCCWLNPLMPAQDITGRIPQSMLYFQQMSRAMALTCTGEVFVLIDDPDQLMRQQPAEQWPSIWLTHEAPVLQGLLKEGTITKLTAIKVDGKERSDKTDDLRNWTPLFKRDNDWNEPIARAIKNKKMELAKSGFYPKYQRRASACGAASQEDPHLDYFG